MFKTYYYVVKLQYLGFRYHGWQKQPNLKTLHLMVDKTLNYIFDDNQTFKTLAAGRTDAMVSAQDAAFELFLKHPLNDLDEFLTQFNYYVPQDIRAVSIQEVDKTFNIIQNPKLKEYLYLFAHGQKNHPFCASIMSTFRESLDIELMKQGASLFIGTHNFRNYCTNAKQKTVHDREIINCEIVENELFQANFFPEESFILKVIGKGFLYHQIRFMMGALVKLGTGEIDLNYIEDSLIEGSSSSIDYIVPASGLILNKIEFQ